MGSSGTEVGIRRLQRVEHVMGTVIGVDVRDEAVAPAVLEKLFAYLRAVDERFSTYKPDSEVSRVGRGELAEADASPDLRHVLALCDDLFRTTGGYFDARHQRAAGGLDPSGLVKGWSV
ncbi:MAG TPA: FAD:protein FMN transferase, partial [Candidatus Limnocylindrales bacterium]